MCVYCINLSLALFLSLSHTHPHVHAHTCIYATDDAPVFACGVCLQASMSTYLLKHACVCVCGLPEVSVLAVYGHTGTIWTWAAGENRTRGRKKSEKDKAREKNIKEKVNE